MYLLSLKEEIMSRYFFKKIDNNNYKINMKLMSSVLSVGVRRAQKNHFRIGTDAILVKECQGMAVSKIILFFFLTGRSDEVLYPSVGIIFS